MTRGPKLANLPLAPAMQAAAHEWPHELLTCGPGGGLHFACLRNSMEGAKRARPWGTVLFRIRMTIRMCQYTNRC